MNKLLVALFAGAIALGSVAATAADEDNAAYKMGMASQRQHDLEAHATNNPPTTAAESKALKDAAMKARAAYVSMLPEEKAMYKKGMRAQRERQIREAEHPIATTPSGTPLIGDFDRPPEPLPPKGQ